MAAWLLAAPTTTQTLTGRVLEEGRETPVAGAVISLLDQDGDRQAETVADSLGWFRLAPPEAGEYIVQAVQYGYETTRTPLLALSEEGNVPLELMMRPLPIGLPGLEVTVEDQAEEFLQPLGHTPATLGRRWIDGEDIEEMPHQVTPAGVVKWRAIPGVWVANADYGNPLSGLCVEFMRTGHPGCAMVVLNGVPISVGEAGTINPYSIEGIALLRPTDATTFYGTRAGNGVVLIWTRRGGR